MNKSEDFKKLKARSAQKPIAVNRLEKKATTKWQEPANVSKAAKAIVDESVSPALENNIPDVGRLSRFTKYAPLLLHRG